MNVVSPLVEILIAVTIMSLISVTMMSYYVSALEKSADESRRIIAVNLARSKLSELKGAFRGIQYQALMTYLASTPQHEPEVWKLKAAEMTLHFGSKVALGVQNINTTDYRFLVTVDNRRIDAAGLVLRKGKLNELLDVPDVSKKYLTKMTVTVYWSQGESESPPARYSTMLESYLLDGGKV